VSAATVTAGGVMSAASVNVGAVTHLLHQKGMEK
jgi:hypothetical protein